MRTSPLPHRRYCDRYNKNDKRSVEPVRFVLGTGIHEYVFMLSAFMSVFLLFIYVAVLAYINKDVLQDVGTNDEDTRDGDHIPLYDNCSQLAFSLFRAVLPPRSYLTPPYAFSCFPPDKSLIRYAFICRPKTYFYLLIGSAYSLSLPLVGSAAARSPMSAPSP